MNGSKITGKPWPIRAKVIKTVRKDKKNKAKYTATSPCASSSRVNIKVKKILLETMNSFENMDELLLVGKNNLQQALMKKTKKNQSKPHLEKIQEKTKRRIKTNIRDPISSSDLPTLRKRNKPKHVEVVGRNRGVKRKLAEAIEVEEDENVEFIAPAHKKQKRAVDSNIVQLYYTDAKQKKKIAKKKLMARLEEIRSTPPLTRARKRMMPQEKLWEFIDPPKRR